jgi:hypothetical protein
MKNLTSQQKRLMLLAGGLIILNVLIFGIVQFNRSHGTRQHEQLPPNFGDLLNERFQQAGFLMKHQEDGYGLFVFLGEPLSDQADRLDDELQLLKSNGVDAVIIIKNKIDTQKHIKIDEGTETASVIMDSAGEKFRVFGISERVGRLLLYHKKTGETLSISDEFHDFQAVEEALLKLGLHPIIRPKIAAVDASELSLMGRQFKLFPFDSLINHAKAISIDLDNLPQENLPLVRRIGAHEHEASSEPMFSQPWAIATDSRDRVFVGDGSANKVFVLNEDGNLISSLGQKGEGPGEFCSPIAIAILDDRILINDACLKVHEFDMNLKFSKIYKLESEIYPLTGMGCIGTIFFAPAMPLPPQRTKLIQMFEMQGGKLGFINSFYDYFQPGEKYSNQMNAVFSFNQIRFATDGKRFLTFSRQNETSFILIDCDKRISYKYQLAGNNIGIIQNKKPPQQAPDYAIRHFFKMSAFDRNGNLYVLVPGGVLEINNLSTHALPHLYLVEPVKGTKSVFGGYESLAVSTNYMFLLSAYNAELAIFKRKMNNRQTGTQ